MNTLHRASDYFLSADEWKQMTHRAEWAMSRFLIRRGAASRTITIGWMLAHNPTIPWKALTTMFPVDLNAACWMMCDEAWLWVERYLTWRRGRGVDFVRTTPLFVHRDKTPWVWPSNARFAEHLTQLADVTAFGVLNEDLLRKLVGVDQLERGPITPECRWALR